jgi:hypothetical protein
MPFTVNGIGTHLCGSRGYTRWGGQPDFDAVECLVFVYLPLIPLKAVHSFNWQGTQYQGLPIRWSWGLVLHAMLRRWIFVPALGGIVASAIGIVDYVNGRLSPGEYVMIGIGVTVFVLSVAGMWAIHTSDRRNRAIRCMLGRHQFGSSDPATWKDGLLNGVTKPNELHGTSTYADAASKCLSAGAYSDAMWSARLSTALENRTTGEMLTDTILNDPNVQEAVARVVKQPSAWAEAMRPRPAPAGKPSTA